MYIIGLTFIPVIIGGFFIWCSLGILEQNVKSVLAYLLMTIGNLLIFFPLSIIIIGHGLTAYFVGTIISFAVAVFLMNELDDGSDEDDDDDYEDEDDD